MSTGIPPKPYFDSINFNPNFFKVVQTYLTEAIANLKYLKLIGGTLTGFLGIGREPRVGLDVNAKAIIDTGINTAPANGEFGSNGTRIILYNGSSIEPPYALGINTNTLWYGTASTGSHRFYTGINERLVINSSGLVGIGTNDPKSKITINATPIQTGSTFDYSISPITITNPNPTSTTAINDPKPLLYLCRDGTGGQNYASKATFNLCRYENSGTNSRTRLDLALTNDAFNDVNIMSLKSNGYVGIGTTDPITLLTLKTSYSDATKALCLDSSDSLTYNLKLYSAVSLAGGGKVDWFFQVNNQALSTNALIIRYDGNVGIGTNNPLNILQVGLGGRLKIANDDNGYTIIGARDADGLLNSRIVLGGATRSDIPSLAGCTEYIVKNNHVFISTSSGAYINKVVITPDDFQINTSCSTYGANYYTDGEYIMGTSKTNASGVVKTGYFITNEYFFNSLVMIAVSHNDSTYTHWHGYYGTNNSTAVMYITAINSSNMTFESFQEQTTNKSWIFVRPSIAFNLSVQLRVKFYG